MVRPILHFGPRFLLLTFIAVMTSFPAAAGSWGGSDVSIRVGVWNAGGKHHHHPRHWGPGRRDFWGHRHYAPPRASIYFYGSPVYYPPRPRVVYYSYPSYPTYPPVVAAVPVSTGQCTQFNGDATIDGSGTPFYGRACIFTDGRWHIVP